MTKKEQLEKEIAMLVEECKTARAALNEKFDKDQDTCQYFNELYRNQREYKVHSINFTHMFDDGSIGLNVIYQDGFSDNLFFNLQQREY